MPQRQIPETWRTLLDQKGIRSARDLSIRAGISHTVVNRTIYGDTPRATDENLQKMADVLGVDYPTMYALAGRAARHVERWEPPAVSARLSPEDRRLVEDMIYRLADGPGVRRQQWSQPAPEDVHPERDGLRLAADTSHGPSQWQEWEDDEHGA